MPIHSVLLNTSEGSGTSFSQTDRSLRRADFDPNPTQGDGDGDGVQLLTGAVVDFSTQEARQIKLYPKCPTQET
ncbi:hypothetical protein FCV25MIE_34832 [Fagus crenata]